MSDIVRMDELEEAERKAAKPRWKRRQFWRSAIPLFVSAVLLVVGTVLALKHYQTQVSNLWPSTGARLVLHACATIAGAMCGMFAGHSMLDCMGIS